MTNGFWYWGLLFWRPHEVKPPTPCSVRPPLNGAFVGKPVMPYASSMFAVPVPYADLPASVRFTPTRSSSSEVADRVRVRPNAYCWFSTST